MNQSVEPIQCRVKNCLMYYIHFEVVALALCTVLLANARYFFVLLSENALEMGIFESNSSVG